MTIKKATITRTLTTQTNIESVSASGEYAVIIRSELFYVELILGTEMKDNL